MRIRLNFFLVALAQKLILINLLAVFISGSLVFAQGPEYFVLIVTKGNSLNVREEPLVQRRHSPGDGAVRRHQLRQEPVFPGRECQY